MKLAYTLAALATTLGGTLSLQAHAETYQIDPVHTQVIFFVNHLGFSNSSGKFHVSTGAVQYDPAQPAKSSVQVKINTASLDMGDATWKEHLSGEHFFETDKFPTIEFRSTKVESAGEGKLRVLGDLTIHGVTKPVVLDTTVNKVAPHPMTKKPAAGFSATTKIKRSDFGMDYYVPNISDEVQIRLEIEATAG